jgi:uncharacterized membrane protein
MLLLLLGLVLWFAAHMFKAYAPAAHAQAVTKLGEGPVKGGVSIALVASIVLMVIGAQSATPAVAYIPPVWGWHANNLLMLIAFVLLGAGHMKSNIARVIRHPMLMAAAVWAVAHLLANGEWRDLVLFGGLGVWAVASMVLINRRDGAWTRPPASPVKRDGIAVAAGTVAFLVVALLHWLVFGVYPFGGGA